MQRPIWRLGAALAVALGIVAACGGETAAQGGNLSFSLTATPRQINDRGRPLEPSRSTATNADGTAGAGTSP